MHTVLLAIHRWLPYFKLYKLVIFTDNAMVNRSLRRRSVRGPAMVPLCKITDIAALHNIDIYTQWIPALKNALADLLSRRNFAKPANQFPLLTQEPLAEIHQSHGTQTSAFPESQPATSGGALAQITDEHTKQLAVAM